MTLNKKILIIVLFFSILIVEGGMRIAVWTSLYNIVPKGVKYDFYISDLDNSFQYSCTSSGRKDYMDIIYTYWIFSIIESKMICQYQGPHMALRVFESKKIIDYHWSFYSLSLVKNPYN